MTTIRNRVVTADGDPIEGVRVVVYPVLASDPTRLHHPAVDPAVEEEILLGGETVTNATGDWTMDVTPTTALEPTDAVGYRVVQYPPGGNGVGAFDRVVIVPDSAAALWVPNLTELDPEAVTAIAPLDKHAGDTTNVHGIADAGALIQHDGTLLVGGLGKVKSLGPPILEHLDPDALGALTVEGPWAAGTAYAERSIVTHNATVWVANANTVAGEEPGVSAKWTEIPTGVDSELRSWLPIFAADYGAVGDGVTDDTAAIQAAVAALGGNPGVVSLGTLTCLVTSPIVLADGQVLIGESHAATDGAVLKAGTGFTGAAVIKSASWDTAGTWWHYAGVRDVTIECNDVAAVGIAIHQMGEDSLLERVTVRNATGDGFLLTGTHAVGTLVACSAFGNNAYGVSFDVHPTHTADGNGGTARLLGFSGDLNTNGLVEFTGAQSLSIIGLKSEEHDTAVAYTGTATGGGAATAFITGSSIRTGAAAGQVVLITGGSPVIVLGPIHHANHTYLINDTGAAKTLPFSEMAQQNALTTWNGETTLGPGGLVTLGKDVPLTARRADTGAKVSMIHLRTDNIVAVKGATGSAGFAVVDADGTILARFRLTANGGIDLTQAVDIDGALKVGAGTPATPGTVAAFIAAANNVNYLTGHNAAGTRIVSFGVDANGHATIVVRDSGGAAKVVLNGATGTVAPSAVASTARPSPVSAGAGAMMYDTTLSKPLWSDGSNWRDATGAAV